MATKLLLLALLGLTLVALAVSSENESERSVDFAKSALESRETREANPAKMEKKKKKKNKQLKKKKSKKGKKKSSKKINKSSKGKKNSKKGKKKSKKNKKNKSKGKKSGKERKNKTGRTSNLRQSCTSDDECLTAASKYMNAVKGKVSNFLAQKTRAEKFEKLTSNKGNKKDEFKGILSKLKEAGGGNATALQCGGSTTSPAAKRLQALVDDMAKCEENIKEKCTTNLPTYDKTTAEQCSTDMAAFSSEVDKCVTGGGCTCWKANTLTEALAKISSCDFSKTNGQFASFKKTCIEAFGACRQLQDAAGQALTNCKTNAADVKAKIDATTKNKESLTALKEKATALATAAAQSRRLRSLYRSLSCASFSVSFEVVINMANEAPTSDKVSSSSTTLIEATGIVCSPSEKTTLLGLIKLLEEVIAYLETVIAELTNDYEALTQEPTTVTATTEGTTAATTGASSTAASSTAASTTAASTTAASTTAASTTAATTKPTTAAASFKCGIKKQGTKIVGGSATEVNEYPWMAHLTKADGSPYGCGGTLVSKEWVITASHCIILPSGTTQPSQIKVALGEHDLSTTSETTRLLVAVDKIITHETYGNGNFRNDIALLRLATKVDITVYTPACIQATPSTALAGKTAWVYGWGTLSSGGSSPNKLQEVSVPIVTTDACKVAYGTSIVDGMVCAGSDGKDSCQGDSGGPMTVEDAATKQHSLVGVVSWGQGCAAPGFYGVYADVGFYKSWLDGKFSANGGITLTP